MSKKLSLWICGGASALVTIIGLTQDEIVIVLAVVACSVLFTIGASLASPVCRGTFAPRPLIAIVLFICACSFVWCPNVIGMVILRGLRWSIFLSESSSRAIFLVGLIVYVSFMFAAVNLIFRESSVSEVIDGR